NKRFLLKVDKERLESAPGFDKDKWPDMADPTWQNTIHSYYGTKPYIGPTDTPDVPYDDTPYTQQPPPKNLDSGRIS
ncbi:MAG: PRC-barrel domain containing protein, partial [Pseudomonadota bacterium]|nr:PRC-barrel domain containing protein [Pseudomonadota bacterium]